LSGKRSALGGQPDSGEELTSLEQVDRAVVAARRARARSGPPEWLKLPPSLQRRLAERERARRFGED
jgi:hypothetical protein